jgi:hypothetical protein
VLRRAWRVRFGSRRYSSGCALGATSAVARGSGVEVWPGEQQACVVDKLRPFLASVLQQWADWLVDKRLTATLRSVIG